MKPFDGVYDILASLSVKKALVSKGEDAFQQAKLELLDLEKYFDLIIFTQENKEASFRQVQEEWGLKQEDILVFGNRIDSEIRCGNKLGMQTLFLKHGKYKDLEPESDDDIPQKEIYEFKELVSVL